MTVLALVALFLAVAGSGPAFDDARGERRRRRDFPRVRLLPIPACRRCGRVGCTWHS